MKEIRLTVLVVFAVCAVANAAGPEVPEPFKGYDNDSKYAIGYDDLTALLRVVVVDVGRSDRRVAAPAQDITGTRMKPKIKKTANEGNRFYFETFDENEAGRDFLKNIQSSLEQLPDEAPLKYFSRDEQLAYWLNLYNVTVLNQVIDVYPKNNLKSVVSGRKSIFTEKLLTVAGVPLSLDDIELTILRQNYDNNPLIIYGLYQGIIGGPNIRRAAYTGDDVWRALENNALEFINSNRGTYIHDEKTFRVSSLYERHEDWFPDFDADLTAHLTSYLEGPERSALRAASKIKPDIDDWSVTDLGSNQRRVGGSLADNRAALMDSMRSTTPADPSDVSATLGVTGSAVGYGSSFAASKGRQLSLARIDPGLLVVLHDLDDKRKLENERKSTVEIEELGDNSPADTGTAEPAQGEEDR